MSSKIFSIFFLFSAVPYVVSFGPVHGKARLASSLDGNRRLQGFHKFSLETFSGKNKIYNERLTTLC